MVVLFHGSASLGDSPDGLTLSLLSTLPGNLLHLQGQLVEDIIRCNQWNATSDEAKHEMLVQCHTCP
jgi:hypothetical protein